MLDLAQREYGALGHMLEPAQFPDELFGFHAQQVVEKAIKAWICLKGTDYPHVHDLKLLYQVLEDAGEGDLAPFRELIHLSDFAVHFRYDVYDDEALDRQATLANVGRLVERVTGPVAGAQPTP